MNIVSMATDFCVALVVAVVSLVMFVTSYQSANAAATSDPSSFRRLKANEGPSSSVQHEQLLSAGHCTDEAGCRCIDVEEFEKDRKLCDWCDNPWNSTSFEMTSNNVAGVHEAIGSRLGCAGRRLRSPETAAASGPDCIPTLSRNGLNEQIESDVVAISCQNMGLALFPVITHSQSSQRRGASPTKDTTKSSDEFSLYFIDLARNSLTRLDSSSFHRSHEVAYSASSTSGATLPSTLTSLIHLRLSDNRIHSIGPGTFTTVAWSRTLRTVDLSGNALTELSRWTLNGLGNSLRRLDLSSNRLGSIADGAFRFLTGLSRLDLSANRLRELRADTFEGLAGLGYLVLSDNQVVLIERGAFRPLVNLVNVVLRGNPIGQQVDNIQFHSSSLTYIDMSECRLTALPRRLSTTSVNYFQLRRNNITSVASVGSISGSRVSSTLGRLRSVDTLVLDDNQIEFVEDGAFDRLDRLSQLWLNGNRMTSVPRRLPGSLRRLLMDFNLVENLTDPNTFLTIPRLTTLSMTSNRIERLSPEVMAPLTSLRHLDLDNNRLTSIRIGTFDRLSGLRTLHLSGNPLRRLDLSWLRGLTSLTSLKLAYISTTVPAPTIATLSSSVKSSSSAPASDAVPNKILADSSISLPPMLTLLNLDSSPGLAQLIARRSQRQCDRMSTDETPHGNANGNRKSSCEPMKLGQLRHFYARSSDLRTISPDFATMFHEGATVALSSTSWHCDHSIRWFRDWLRASASSSSADDVELYVPSTSPVNDQGSRFESLLHWKKAAAVESATFAPMIATTTRRSSPIGATSSATVSRSLKLYAVQSANCDDIDDVKNVNSSNYSESKSRFRSADNSRSSSVGFTVHASAMQTPSTSVGEKRNRNDNNNILRPVPRVDARFEADNRCATPRSLFGRTVLSLTDDELQMNPESHVNDVVTGIASITSVNHTICQVAVEHDDIKAVSASPNGLVTSPRNNVAKVQMELEVSAVNHYGDPEALPENLQPLHAASAVESEAMFSGESNSSEDDYESTDLRPMPAEFRDNTSEMISEHSSENGTVVPTSGGESTNLVAFGRTQVTQQQPSKTEDQMKPYAGQTYLLLGAVVIVTVLATVAIVTLIVRLVRNDGKSLSDRTNKATRSLDSRSGSDVIACRRSDGVLYFERLVTPDVATMKVCLSRPVDDVKIIPATAAEVACGDEGTWDNLAEDCATSE